MDNASYLLGVLLAIISGSVNNVGLVFQKKVVNELSEEEKFFRNLVKKPLWITGLLREFAVGSIFFMIAQLYIGPALIPGLMAFGLIFLAIGSVKIVGESLKKEEIIGILMMVIAIFFLGVSELQIEIGKINLLNPRLIINMTIFTLSLYLGSIVCEILRKRGARFKGILLSISSGFQFSLTNFWVAPLMAFFSSVFSGTTSLGGLILFIITSGILIISIIIGIAKTQQAFQVANASRMVPIQQVPIQITPFWFIF
ncbi:MAG: hypothetical protein ACTSXH_03700 [Promethearchaeota archaeon]